MLYKKKYVSSDIFCGIRKNIMENIVVGVIVVLIVMLTLLYTNRNKLYIYKSDVSRGDVNPRDLALLESAEGYCSGPQLIPGGSSRCDCCVLGLNSGDYPRVCKISKVNQPYSSDYSLNVYAGTEPLPAFEIRLLYKEGCGKHRLKMIFDQIAKQYTAQMGANKYSIKFTTEIVDDTLPQNLWGFPKLIKIRRNGQVLIYSGYTNYGEVYDWIMDESLLF